MWQLTGFTSYGSMVSWVRIPPGRKRSVAQLVERMFNPVISPYYVPTAIAAYFFSWDDSGKIRRLLVIIIAEDGDMREIYKDYLFEKHILVRENNVEEKNVFETLFALAHFFGIRIIKGEKLVDHGMIGELSKRLGENVPEPFYKGFPKSVRELTTEELLFDQLLHYFTTYGLGDFDESGHSVFEKDFERAAFQEDAKVKEFEVQTKEEAEETIKTIVHNLLAGSRPLNERQYALVLEYILDHGNEIPDIASKNTMVRLLIDTKRLSLADEMNLSDVMKVVDELNYHKYSNSNPKKLNFKNQDRKFLKEILDRMFKGNRCDIRTCYEKKQLWNGFLHHIHYRPKNEAASVFVRAMREKGNESVYSEFEKLMRENRRQEAANLLREKKGNSSLLRNLDYIISRMDSEEAEAFLSDFPEDCSALILLQLLFRYESFSRDGGRTFKFSRHNLLKVHAETNEEQNRRKSKLSEDQVEMLKTVTRSRLKGQLKNKLGKVYVDPAMKNYALPLAENTSQGGYGVLSKGSRISFDEGKKLRAFTYWEKVNDIDLSVFALTEEGRRKEFSWRTMAGQQSDAITYSGDETSGYNGGSEYFDINLPEVKARHPEYRYLIFCDNVFSRVNFNKCFCKAGYMLRDEDDSGEIYEPKTVESAFLVDCESTFAYLFGIDLLKNEFIWLNQARNSNAQVAGNTPLAFLLDYFHVTEIFSVYDFFELMAEEMVEDPLDAEIVVTDHETVCSDGAEIIREYDFERLRALMG